MSTRLQRQRFELRFYRGHLSTDTTVSSPAVAEEWCERVCGCGKIHIGKVAAETSKCFACSNLENPYAQKGIRMSVEAEGEDSTNPQRIREGTSHLNIGLRGIDTVVGTRPNGKPKLEYRPIANNELPTARARREYAKRTNCTPGENSVKRAVGGRD